MGLVESPGDQLDCKSRRKVEGLVILGSWRIVRVTLQNENWLRYGAAPARNLGQNSQHEWPGPREVRGPRVGSREIPLSEQEEVRGGDEDKGKP